ncbi:MAG: PBP1A family penicillin-binding protein [Candidatus Eisenbacteria bacterium]|uniref:PBP1A family penicillin-binding protein n=1 Tax=Eiseniibacteriota bacterium TaxID=2212470 RepID=A0A948RYX0_UNCEI|nr:PBP1A family penicillin-binding protein [Candidatus Eisenbacteria bacterium]MBU1950470.1 PBP1A family penicillin-binding protein [Candidatus Eisenbacteria bacterium]MBU2692521.1 PBP1A family penicillin-binding protein [Candidatus Eisenbacteria bacterium]
MKAFLISAVATPLLLGAILFGLFQWAGDDLPRPQSFREVEASLKSRVLDTHGQLIREFYIEDRSPIALPHVPKPFLDAIIATEDRQFSRHWGIDLIGILRAFKADVMSGSFTQGASTLTQQLARNVFLTHQRTVLRKLREAVLAIRLERAFGKDEILELYINQVYFGEGAHGIEAAAYRFFGISAADLNIPQSALLAGILAGPNAFSPFRHPEKALSRRNIVLRRMRNMGSLSEENYLVYREEPLGLNPPDRISPLAPYATEMVRQYVIQNYGPEALFREGLTIWTTIDLDLQAEAEKNAIEHIDWVRKTYGKPQPFTKTGEDTIGLGPLQVALVAIEPQTGSIRALIGGRDFAASPFNRAIQGMGFQPGSSFKPFVFAAAMERGWHPNDFIVDAPVEYEIPGASGSERYYSPKNFSETFAGPVVLRYALAKSINVVAVRLLEEIGADNVIEMAHRLGIRSRLNPFLSLALGSCVVTPMELTNAYATLANQGIRTEPYIIEKIEDRYGATLEDHEPKSESVLDARIAFITTHMMQSVLDFGTGQMARQYGFNAPAAGKTGTTDDYTDAWFVGFTPYMALGVWVGYDRKIAIGHKVTGAVAALPIWARTMSFVADRKGPTPFAPPRGVCIVRTCIDSGQLAGPNCPQPVEDCYLTGMEPVEICDLHGPQGVAESQNAPQTFREQDRWKLHRDPW